MVLNATFNNISVTSSRSVLLVDETVDPMKTTDLARVTDKLMRIDQCNKETKSYYSIQVVPLSYIYR